jgi:hypothetical protein
VPCGLTVLFTQTQTPQIWAELRGLHGATVGPPKMRVNLAANRLRRAPGRGFWPHYQSFSPISCPASLLLGPFRGAPLFRCKHTCGHTPRPVLRIQPDRLKF